ncbi:MAG: methyltransferase domain-containing protein [Candidatus Curtissbacteria bacterium]|nr:methyltransferase domain-containing protein [Candidatus Curtissbacteria bacterium]
MEPEITRLYRLRFDKDLKKRNEIWKILCRDFFQKYIKPSDTVCDLGAGYCEFINNIKAKIRIAIDINPETKKFANKGLATLITSSTNLPKNLYNKVDVVFASNFFEHLSTKEELAKTLVEINKILKTGGKIIVLMPNIRYIGAAYWDFLDHQLPLTEKSMVEALTLNGCRIIEKRNRFLPYTTKSRLPKMGFLVRLYLKLTPLHLLFGKQSLIIAQKLPLK